MGKRRLLANAKYNILKEKVSISENLEEILKLCPATKSPFTITGGGAQGYLFEIDDKLEKYLLNLVNEKNNLELGLLT